MEYKIVYNNQRWNQAAAFSVRCEVFVKEQGISIKDEFDKYDHIQSRYFVIYDGGIPVATARFQELPENSIQPDRVCVLQEYRNQGLGTALMQSIEKQTGAKFAKLNAELSAVEFYEKIGYRQTGGRFKEDGIPVIKMVKQLR